MDERARIGRPAWTYRRAGIDGIVEFGTVIGAGAALPAHFHQEDQITFVLAGRRGFVVAGETITVEPGECVLLRAGVVHQSPADPAGVEAVNLYGPASTYAWSALARDARRLWRDTPRSDPAALAALVAAHRLAPAPPPAAPFAPHGRIGDHAEALGVTREGFSRAFARRKGMPPRAFALTVRLNHARALLRDGAPLVDAALEAGFADQSHLGRCFRRAFGVTPGQFRAGRLAVTNVPDVPAAGR